MRNGKHYFTRITLLASFLGKKIKTPTICSYRFQRGEAERKEIYLFIFYINYFSYKVTGKRRDCCRREEITNNGGRKTAGGSVVQCCSLVVVGASKGRVQSGP